MATPRVRNAGIINALKLLGYIPRDAVVDKTGRQSTTFASRLAGLYDITPELFEVAKSTMSILLDAMKKDPALEERIVRALQTVSPEGDTRTPLEILRQTITPPKQTAVQTGGGPLKFSSYNKRDQSLVEAFSRLDPLVQGKFQPTPTTPPPSSLGVGPREIQTPQQVSRTGAPIKPAKPAVPREKVPVTQAAALTGEDVGEITLPSEAEEISIPPLRKGAPETEVRAYVRKYFGYLSWAMDIPELNTIVKGIAENPSGWTPEAVQGALSSTQWWQRNGINVANWLEKRKADPTSTQNQIKKQFDSLRAAAKAAGIEVPDQRLWAIAEDSLKWAWDETTLQAVLGSEYRFDPTKPTGTTRELKSIAHDYLVPLSDATLGTWTKQILTGDKTEDEFKQFLADAAKSMFPFLSAALDRGDTVEQYLNHYRETVASTLELNPESIDFADPKWMRLLTRIDPKTGERSLMANWEVDEIIRTDPRYGFEYTKKAMADAGTLAATLMKKMGVTT